MILIDQEGGRVTRLKSPNWKSYPSAEFFGNKAEKNLPLAKKLVFKNSMKISLLSCGVVVVRSNVLVH